jgi:hypothetical protein
MSTATLSKLEETNQLNNKELSYKHLFLCLKAGINNYVLNPSTWKPLES